MIHQQCKNITIILLFLLSSLCYPQIIKSVKFINNKVFDENILIKQIKIPPHLKFSNSLEDSIKSRLYKFAMSEGYIDFKVNDFNISETGDSLVELRIKISEGEPVIINKLTISGLNKSDSVNVLPSFIKLEEKRFNKFEIEKIINKSLDYFENNGFPFIQIRINSIYFFFDSLDNEHKANVFITIDKQKKSTIDKIEVLGNTKTKLDVIVRNTRLELGELYSEEKIQEIPQQLNKLRFFKVVDKPNYYFNSNNEGILQIKIKELQTNQFDGIIGYIPASSNTNGFFTGYVNINLRNLFGTGRATSIKWQQEDRFSQELELKYLEPWIFNYPFNIELKLFQRKQDTTYIQRNLTGRIEFLATENISSSLIFSTESIIPNQSDSNRFTVYNSNIITTGIDLTIDTRDDIAIPQKGIYFKNTYKFSSKKINGPKQFISSATATNSNLQRLELDLSIYYSILRKNIILLSVHAKELRSNAIEISDLFRFGGANNLRGYREKQFLGNRIIWSNLEYRLMLQPESFAFAFFDFGYYLKNENKEFGILETSDYLSSYGIGLSFSTSLGMLKVSYAIPKGGTFNKGLIHFGIQNEF